MSRGGQTLRLAVGGAVWGGWVGSFTGAAVGLVYGATCNDLSHGLEGAILGGLAVTVVGALYGVFLGNADRERPLRAPGRLVRRPPSGRVPVAAVSRGRKVTGGGT